MVNLTDAGFEAAEARGREMTKSEPRAAAAHYDRETGRVVVELANGCIYIFPAQLAQELRGADDEALSGVVVDGAGFNLHWPAIDADLYVPALVAGVFGTGTGWQRSGRARPVVSQRPPKPRRPGQTARKEADPARHRRVTAECCPARGFHADR